jgi:hypothetical protein
MSQPALSAEQIAALPQAELFGRPATMVDISGEFSGMNSSTKTTGQRLVGLVLVQPEGAVFLKMVGPESLIGAQVDAFKALAKSFRLQAHGAHPSGDPHAATSGTGTSPGAPSGTQRERRDAGHEHSARRRSHPDREQRWRARLAAASGLGARAGSRDARGDVLRRCRARPRVLRDPVGGRRRRVLANVNRWRKQMGQGEISEKELATLPRVKMLGTEAVLVEIEGQAGPDSKSAGESLMLGTVCTRRPGRCSSSSRREGARRGAARGLHGLLPLAGGGQVNVLRSVGSGLLAVFSSLATTVVLLILLALLTWLGRSSRCTRGLFEVQRKYFESFFLLHDLGPFSCRCRARTSCCASSS